MLPRLTRTGTLPVGTHPAPMSEVVNRFGTDGPRRSVITRRMHHVLALARRTGKLSRAFLWGSYVTAKPEPNDIDVMLVMSSDFQVGMCDAESRVVFDGDTSEDELGATVLWTREDVPPELLEAFLDLWQVGRDGTRRGIVEVLL